eukprot:15439150-Alexandrium_andersonii.AAC.1
MDPACEPEVPPPPVPQFGLEATSGAVAGACAAAVDRCGGCPRHWGRWGLPDGGVCVHQGA